MVIHDTNLRPSQPCSKEREYGKGVHVRVNDLIFVILYDPIDLIDLFQNIFVVSFDLIDTAAEQFDLFIQQRLFIAIDDKIELNFCASDMSIIVHDNGFHSTAAYISNDLQHTNRQMIISEQFKRSSSV